MLGIICAMAVEVEGILNLMENKEETKKAGATFTKGTLHGKDVVVTECGIGKVNAAVTAQVIIDLFSPQALINSGVAGALSDKLRVGDVVISEDAIQHDYDTTAFGDPMGLICFANEQRVDMPADKELCEKLMSACKTLDDTTVLKGRIATGDQFISDTEKRLSLGKEFSALACEMEGGAVGQVCYRNNVPFAILRCISDDLTNSTSMDYEAFKSFAAAKTTTVLSKFIEEM
ncbi:MAG: 5'-methylthioadenosine/adenosylhomocysteine nucleosidase [Clostridia bacterium]|nr:5'-methylthioadenosine/adenosylhomocysteine nucleosidase [Clostridia bacterium]